MRKLIGLGVMCAAVMLSGCATRASGVAPVSVSSNDYGAMTCERQRDELKIARAKEEALRRKQNTAATLDVVGVFLFLVPAGSVLGQDVQGDLAQAKGEVLALERSIVAKCGG